MKKIESLQQLKQQRMLSRMRIVELEERIKEDFEQIKEDLKPLNIAGKALRNMMSSENNTVLGESIGLTVDTLIRKLLFRNSGFMTKLVVAFVVKNFARNLVTKNSENIIDWIQSLFLKLKNRNRHNHNGQHYDASTVDVDLEM